MRRDESEEMNPKSVEQETRIPKFARSESSNRGTESIRVTDLAAHAREPWKISARTHQVKSVPTDCPFSRVHTLDRAQTSGPLDASPCSPGGLSRHSPCNTGCCNRPHCVATNVVCLARSRFSSLGFRTLAAGWRTNGTGAVPRRAAKGAHLRVVPFPLELLPI